MSHRGAATLLIFAILVAGIGAARAQGVPVADLLRHKEGLWALDPVGSTRRWVVIHNLVGADDHSVLHIEVLSRGKDSPPWQFDRLAPHMAITVAALARSVRKPLLHGGVYPEIFEQAQAQWTRDHDAGHAFVCTTSVDQCLKNEW